jgi:hypothetical protein
MELDRARADDRSPFVPDVNDPSGKTDADRRDCNGGDEQEPLQPDSLFSRSRA